MLKIFVFQRRRKFKIGQAFIFYQIQIRFSFKEVGSESANPWNFHLAYRAWSHVKQRQTQLSSELESMFYLLAIKTEVDIFRVFSSPEANAILDILEF